MLKEILETNPAAGIKKALPPVKSKPLAAITTSDKAGALLRAIDGYDDSIVVKKALLFSAYTFCQAGEIRRAEWKEFDLAAGQWIIPADKVKMNRPRTVPLAGQVRELLEELRPMTGHGRFVFPSLRTFDRPVSTTRCALIT